MENPFIITGYIKPEYFCDRKQEAKRIITKITNGENIVIMAARRVGKSKLIDFCLDSPTIKDNFISISIDILRTSSINEFAFELGKAVFEQAARRSSKLLKMVVNTLNPSMAVLDTTQSPIHLLSTSPLAIFPIPSIPWRRYLLVWSKQTKNVLLR